MNRTLDVESRISKLEKLLNIKTSHRHIKNESYSMAVTSIYEAIGEGKVRWKDVVDAFIECADDDVCTTVCDTLDIPV